MHSERSLQVKHIGLVSLIFSILGLMMCIIFIFSFPLCIVSIICGFLSLQYREAREELPKNQNIDRTYGLIGIGIALFSILATVGVVILVIE